MNIPEQKRRVSLVQYAAKTVQLEKRGGEHWGAAHSTMSRHLALQSGPRTTRTAGTAKGATKVVTSFTSSKSRIIVIIRLPWRSYRVSLPHHRSVAERSQRVTAIFQPLGEEKSKNSRPISEWNEFETALSENACWRLIGCLPRAE